MFSKVRALFKTSREPTIPEPVEKPTFSEAAFLEEFNALIEKKKGDQALDFFLSQAGELAASNIHRRIKLNHFRYASKILETQTSSKHGSTKLGHKLLGIRGNLKDIPIPKGGFLDFGCGEHDPLALASIFYFNGFERAIACDLRPPQIPAYSATSMAEILNEMKALPGKYLLPGGNLSQFEALLAEIDIRPFAQRDFDGGLASFEGKVDYRLADLVTLDVDDASLALTVSFAVLEHVLDPEGVYAWLYRKTKPGGIQFHFVDLADHRSYSGKGAYNKWSFLTESESPPNVNRLRAGQHRDALERAGFEIVKEQRTTATIPPETKERLISPWRDLPDEEIDTFAVRFVLRKPD